MVKDYGFNKLITYTTRPIRKNEKEDVTYHYITKEDFKKKVDNEFFAEWKSYLTNDGIWYYGTAKEDLENADDKILIILTPKGFKDITTFHNLHNKTYAVYIKTDDNVIKKRLIKRGDKRKEAERRIEHDSIDFQGVEDMVDFIITNNGDVSLTKIVDKIAEEYNAKR